MCRAVVFPSLFEGWGFPVLEAFSEGVPVACSSASTLAETAADAALLFDPANEESIADAVLDVWSDERRRNALVGRGTARIQSLQWPETARRFRGLYRQVATRT
jgi:glycosyltransferase involved in cell wall biosynthesis